MTEGTGAGESPPLTALFNPRTIGGLAAEAEAETRGSEDPLALPRLRGNLVVARVAARDLPAAEAAAEALQDREWRGKALVVLVAAYARAGDRPALERVLEQFDLAMATDAAVPADADGGAGRDRPGAGADEAAADASQFCSAVARSLGRYAPPAAGGGEAALSADKYLALARTFADHVAGPLPQSRARFALAAAQSALGRLDAARRTAATITVPAYRSGASLPLLAGELRRATGAPADGPPSLGPRRDVPGEAFAGARSAVAGLTLPLFRAQAAQALASAWACGGRLEDVAAWVASLPTPRERACACAGVAEGLLRKASPVAAGPEEEGD